MTDLFSTNSSNSSNSINSTNLENSLNALSDKIFDIVVFHYPCQDGLSSAYVVDMFHKKLNVEQPELYPIQHGTELKIDKFINKKVIFCDYSPNLLTLELIEKVASKIVVLDHHITAKQALQDKSYAIFDMNQSGVGLTWSYFFPEQELPKFLAMIQDRDIWTWLIPDSKPFTNGFFLICSTVDTYDFHILFNFFEELYNNNEKIDFYINIGNILQKSNEQKIKKISESALKSIHKYLEYNVCVVNCTCDFVSELGNSISSDPNVDFAVIWKYNNTSNEYYISLRSCGSINVAQIAKSFGGGGHVNAAGFSLKGKSPLDIFCSNMK